jgi:hypothetical protein
MVKRGVVAVSTLIIDADGHVEEDLAQLWRCRQAYRVAAAGGGVPMDPDVAWRYGELFRGNDFSGMFEAMARQELRRDPEILR